MSITQTDKILNYVYDSLRITSLDDNSKYERINDIIKELQKINKSKTINAKTTGTISERLCELALKSSVSGLYSVLGSDWKWIGDFSILGNPFNLIISVKSFKAKERLMTSGTGNVLSPTVGWGLFDDIKEWTPGRAKGYMFRAFIAIYMPELLYKKLKSESKNLQNVNAKPFLRSIDKFTYDLKNSLSKNRIDITKI